jgi:Zn-dependent protease
VVSLFVTFAVLREEIGWGLAVGFLWVVGAHELGHMAVASHLGIPVTWPVFIPKIGGFVVTLRGFKDAREEACVALGGPVAGVFATAVLHVLGVWWDSTPVLELTIFCYALHLVNMIPAGMLDGGRVAALIGRPLWVPGLIGLLCVAYKYSSDSWLEIMVALLVLWPAVNRARIVLVEWIRREPTRILEQGRAGFFPVASIFVGVLLFGGGGLLLARMQHAEMEIKWMEAFVNNPPSWMNQPAADGGVQTDREQETLGCF